MRHLLLVLLALPLLGQNPIIFSGKRSPARSGAQGIWMMQNPNLAKYSQSFDNAAWNIRTGSIKTTGIADPFGGTSAVRVTTTSNDGYLFQSTSIPLVIGTQYTMSGWVRSDSVSPPQVIIKSYDGVSSICVSAGRYTLTTTWTRTSCTFTAATTSLSDYGIIWASSPSAGTTYDFAFYQINEGSTALPYVATTDAQTYPNLVSGGAALQRGSTSGTDTSDPTRRGVGLSLDGVDDLVSGIPAAGATYTKTFCSASECYTLDSNGAEYVNGAVRTNRLKWSEAMNISSTWPILNGSITGGGVFTESAANAVHQISQTIPVSAGVQYDIYVDAKKGSGDKFMLYVAGAGWNKGSGFDLTNGSVFTVSSITRAVSDSISDIGGGVYRCSISGSSSATSIEVKIFKVSGTAYSYAGDGVSTIQYIKAWVVQSGMSPNYQRTEGASIPALDTGGAYGAIFSGLGLWSRILGAGEIIRDYFRWWKPQINAAGGTLP